MAIIFLQIQNMAILSMRKSYKPGKERQACIIVENGSVQDLQIGVASGNATGTDINVGTSRLFKTENASMIALRSPNSKSLVPLYSSASEANITPGNLETMQQGCMTSFSGVTRKNWP